MGLIERYGVTMNKSCAGSQAPALIVIHKWSKLVIPAWTAGIQSQGGESAKLVCTLNQTLKYR